MQSALSISAVEAIVANDLDSCTEAEQAYFERVRVVPYYSPLPRHGTNWLVVVVARQDALALYWEDVEEGFNVSPVDSDGNVLEHWCNQDTLGVALRRWMTA